MFDLEALMTLEADDVDAAGEGAVPSECVGSRLLSCNERFWSSATGAIPSAGDFFDTGASTGIDDITRTGDISSTGDVDMSDMWPRRYG